jgi:DNA-binding GntR family transcriptional regulator
VADPLPDPGVQAIIEHLRDADVLDIAELRELVPSVLMLEAQAIRDSPPFDAAAIAELRAANQRLRDSAGDPDAATEADDDFHRRLTARCGNAQLLEVVDVVRKALLSYERVYFVSPERLAGSVAEHEAIVAALEAGDHGRAADCIRRNFMSGLPSSDGTFGEPERPA